SLRVIPADPSIDARSIDLRHPRVRETPVHKAVDPVILRLAVQLDIAVGEPVSREGHVDVIVEREVVAEVGDVPRVPARRAHDIVQTEMREQNAAAPPTANVIE